MVAENEYEAARAARIAANKERMRALGLGAGGQHQPVGLSDDASGAGARLPDGDKRAPKLRRAPGGGSKRSRPAPPERTSRRLRGFNADGTPADKPVVVRSLAEDSFPGEGGIKRRGLAFPDPANYPDCHVAAPFSLASIGVTVLDLGVVHRAAFAPRYWSSKGCLYHHAYPVGYRASKTHFGRSWTMTIDAGEVGPIFRVVDDASGAVFEGVTPTKPWTAVCESMRTKTRISGPLFFGFSDPVTMRALAELYTAEELAACVSGGTVPSAPGEHSALERVVAELERAVEGMGANAAIALASSEDLSRLVDPEGSEPRRLASAGEVRAAAAKDPEAIREVLCGSKMLPAATLAWPAWRARIVPKIIAALTDDARAGSDSPLSPTTRNGGGGRASGGLKSTAGANAEGEENVAPGNARRRSYPWEVEAA